MKMIMLIQCSSLDAGEQTNQLCDILTNSLPNNVWNVQISILESMSTFLDHCAPGSLGLEASTKIVESCIHCLEDMKYSAIRTAAVAVLEDAVKHRTCKSTTLADSHAMGYINNALLQFLVDNGLKASLAEKLELLLSKEQSAAIQERIHAVLNTLRQ